MHTNRHSIELTRLAIYENERRKQSRTTENIREKNEHSAFFILECNGSIQFAYPSIEFSINFAFEINNNNMKTFVSFFLSKIIIYKWIYERISCYLMLAYTTYFHIFIHSFCFQSITNKFVSMLAKLLLKPRFRYKFQITAVLLHILLWYRFETLFSCFFLFIFPYRTWRNATFWFERNSRVKKISIKYCLKLVCI